MFDNTGHGHVWSRPDGLRAACGGPAECFTCRADQLALEAWRRARQTAELSWRRIQSEAAHRRAAQRAQ